jgi:phosphatidate cytidylyltransferase
VLRSRILTAAILAALLLVGLFLLPPRWTVAAFGAVFTFGAWEWARFGSLRSQWSRILYALGIALLLLFCWVWTSRTVNLVILLDVACVWWVLAALWLSWAPGRHRPALTLLCGVPVLVPAFIAVARLEVATTGFARGPEVLFWLLLLVIGADIGAFVAGRSLGRRKLAPRVSPGKTWEGAIGGLLTVAAVAAAGTVHFGLSVGRGVAFGCAVGIFSIVGDLTESMFKRAAGLKDSGALLPGHGGMLDRIDSVTAAAPLYALGLFGSGVIA